MQQQRISNSNGLVTPAEYARRIGVNRSTISRQIRDGVIPDHDGLVDPGEADHCRRARLSMSRGRNTVEQRERASAAAPAPESERAADPVECHELLDQIRAAAAVRLPELARRLGLPEFIAHDAANIFDALLGLCDADPGEYEWEPVAPDPPEAPAKVGRQADRYYDEKLLPAVDAIFSAAVLAHPERYPWVSLEWARGIQAEGAGAKPERAGRK